MRRIALFTFLIMLLMTVAASAAERVPLRVAQFPLQVQSYYQPSQQVIDGLERQVDRSLHVPLNDTLKAVEFIPERQCMAAWEESAAEIGGKTRWKDVVKSLAEKLQADLVVVPVVTGYEQYTYMSWNWRRGQLLHSYAAVQIVGYDRAKDEVFRKSSSRRYDDEYMSSGEVERLVAEAMDDALHKAAIHDRVWNWKTNIR